MDRLLKSYTLIAATIMFFANLIFFAGPARTANLIILTPLVALSWINFTNPRKSSETVWSLRMLIVVFCLSLIGLAGFKLASLSNCPQSSPCLACPTPPAAVVSDQNQPIPPASPSPLPLVVGAITINNPNRNDYLTTYPYVDFQNGSFKIIIDATTSAWIKLEDVIPQP